MEKARTDRRLRAIIGSITLAIAALALLPLGVRADVTVIVSPSLQEFAVDAGSSFTQVIKVSNEGSDKAYISAEVSAYAQDRPDISADGWFRAEPQQFELAPGESQEVSVHVNVPEGSRPGGKYATVYFRTSPLSLEGRKGRFIGGTAVGARVGSVFLITVRGADLKLEGQLTRVVPVVTGPGRLGTRMEITNTGNVHMYPEGKVELTDKDGNVVGEFTLPDTTAILPGETKSFYLDGVKAVADGDYKATGKIEFGWDQEQIKAVKVAPEKFSQQDSSEEITFNSVPKLRVIEVQMQGSDQSGAEVKLVLENYGDVEVAPSGFVDVLNLKGERAALLNIGAGSFAVEPHSLATQEYVYRGLMPKGDYSLAAKLNYHGEETATRTDTAKIEQDIVPPVAPAAPEARRLAYEPGTPVWVWGALAAAAAAVLAALGGMGLMVRRLSGQRVAAAPPPLAHPDS